MSVNPICGRNGCKYKVAHEHVQFLSSSTTTDTAVNIKGDEIPVRITDHRVPDNDGISLTMIEHPPGMLDKLAAKIMVDQGTGHGLDLNKHEDISESSTGADVSRIAEALRKLPCSDDPGADRFAALPPGEAQLKVVQERVAKVSKDVDKLANDMADVPEIIYEMAAKIQQQNSKDLIRWEAILKKETPMGKLVLAACIGSAITASCAIIIIGVAIKYASFIWGQ